ncbi:MAG: hypothetical protein Ta2B_05720 [Termitinemataceae bacterium]|nr:MAG: hypothetical protein Ta2B_05720 [Termitinemataceae bacterium]
MKCINHAEVDAVTTCVRCGAGLCQDCNNNTVYKIDNKPLCRKCNYEIASENVNLFRSALTVQTVKLVIFILTFVIGIVSLFISLSKESSTFGAVIGMLFFWGLGFIANFFDNKNDNRSVKKQTKEALDEVHHPLATLFGKLIGFFIMAVSSPIQIILLLVGTGKVKKQLTEATSIANSFTT